jgi:hypothetical protein
VLTTIISYIRRPYNDATYDDYNQWYRSSTRTLLTGPPPEDYTQVEQLDLGPERTAAYHRETSVLTFVYKYYFIAIKINIHNILLLFSDTRI